jgi:hypothetical protein
MTPVLILFLLCSCSDSSSPESQWENIGVQQVIVDQLDIQNTSTTVDTLSIGISGYTETTGRLTPSAIEDERISDKVTLTVWAEVLKWVGTGIMPTIDPSVQCAYKAIPPFDEGMFYIVIEQPDGSHLVDSVLIAN